MAEARGHRGVGTFADDAGGERAGGFDVHGIVEQGERLQRSIGTGASHRARRAGGGVEIDEARVRRAALPHGVETAAIRVFSGAQVVGHLVAADLVVPETGGLKRADGRAAERWAEESADREGVIADGLRVEAEARAAGEEAVLIVAGPRLRRDARRLAVGGGQGDEAVKVFHAPAVCDEFDGEPVE